MKLNAILILLHRVKCTVPKRSDEAQPFFLTLAKYHKPGFAFCDQLSAFAGEGGRDLHVAARLPDKPRSRYDPIARPGGTTESCLHVPRHRDNATIVWVILQDLV